MTKNAKRFENRETTVKGFIINTATQEFTPFEEVVSYVRSAQKAVELVREKMQLDDNPQIIVTVNEIINEAPKPIKYNDSKIYDLCYNHFDSEEYAKEVSEIDKTEYRAITWYEISCYVWAIDANGEYLTEFYADETPVNMTKVDQRDFMRMSYEDFSGNKVIGIHATEKKPIQIHCVITAENLAKCIEQ